jgi:glycosyltransferase involved in cell wall biosynthesis
METKRTIYNGGYLMKKLTVICAPLSSRSGYGAHARDLVSSLIEHDKYDIKIMDVRWGECPRDALNVNNKNDKKILDCILKPGEGLDRQPDLYIDIRIPNEFQTIGKFNIGITAGVETNAVSQAWIDGCNKMDLIIVPSNHSKNGFVSTIYDKMQDIGGGKQNKIGEMKLEKPIEVLFEGADEDIYKPLHHKDIDKDFFNWLNGEVPEKFAFLVVGQWSKGGFGEDRKDIGKTIKIFYESFANKKKQPALILKTNGATYSILDREECLTKLKQIKSMFPKDWKLPNVYLLHGDLSNEEMNYLYNHPKVKSMVSFTHGEGFGRPLLEATMTGLPLVVSGWSGQTDFILEDKTMIIDGEIKQVPKSVVWKDIIIPESQWFNINESTAYKALNYCFNNQMEIKRLGKDLMNENREKFTLSKMSEKFDEIMEKYTKNVATQVSLNLPKLKKVNKSEDKTNSLPKLKLPKLNKVGV